MDKHVAFIGSGMIGTGFATNTILHGIPAVLYTLPEDVEMTNTRLASCLKVFVDHDVVTEEERDQALSICRVTTSIEDAVTGAYYIQESVADDVPIKQGVIAQIEEFADEDAIIATSTSSLSVSEIFSKAKHPERCVGGHPYNPAYLIPLVEITKTAKNTPEAVQKAKDFYESIGKEPVVLNKEVIGFISNRYQSAIHREAVDLVETGVCSVEDADKALVYSVGLRWSVLGQFLSMHLGVAPEGIANFDIKMHNEPGKPDKRLSTMATWDIFPTDWCEVAAKGVEEEIAHRPPEMGNDIDSICEWRDDMLFKTLKLHGKM